MPRKGREALAASGWPADTVRASEKAGTRRWKRSWRTRPATQYRVTAGELRQFVERYERLELERRDLADQMKEVMAEARARGYDVKVLKKLIALRKRDPSEVSEEEAILELYKQALGMS